MEPALPVQCLLAHSPLAPQRRMDLPSPCGSNLGCTRKQNARPVGKPEVKRSHLAISGACELGPTERALCPSCPPSSGLCLRGCSSAGSLGAAFFPPWSSMAWCSSELTYVPRFSSWALSGIADCHFRLYFGPGARAAPAVLVPPCCFPSRGHPAFGGASVPQADEMTVSLPSDGGLVRNRC